MTVIGFDHAQTSYTLHAIPGDHITTCIAGAGAFYELDLLTQIQSYNRTGTYVDVGAHVGNHSVFFATQCPSTSVIAFEPNPLALNCLLENARRYGVTVNACAVHDVWAHCRVIDPYDNHGQAYIEYSASVDDVPCQRLDDCDLQNVAVIKIDVEGNELAVLRSAVGILQRDRPIISAEARTVSATDTLDEYLKTHDYRRQAGVYGRTPTYIWIAPTGAV